MPTRNAIGAHAQGFIIYDKLPLPILKACAQYTQYMVPEVLYIFSLCVGAEKSVTVTNSSPVILPADKSLGCPARIVTWSECILVHSYQYCGELYHLILEV
jgi:hypothetical protein